MSESKVTVPKRYFNQIQWNTIPSNTRMMIKPILAFIKNETPLLIRLKVPFSSSLFLAIRIKKLQITFSSRLTSFSTNSNKVWIDFTHNFAHSAPSLLSEKCFFPYSIIRASFLSLTNQSASKKTCHQNRVSEPSEIV